ncbi:DUF2184 domain-containing protein [Phormidium sp. FACHB-592]|uniref:DUF2184 domain-containing protein n=1 Tax=Stenomitos frigidus AS-A4 TaxID=2933935 RepID=A0ABV0KEZ9_9CYAN|nr:major capsid family protein [Phormidium sp. FACHB-592]MBD2076208.1 DUF2184 domain-containing protein [Phormidium sp. FACHB-592]
MPVEQGGMYLYRDLEQRLPRLIEPRRRELPFESGTDIPTMPDLMPGAHELVSTVINDVGDAKILADGAFDFPLVDATASEDRHRVVMAVAGFHIDFQAERREMYALSNAAATLRVRQYDQKMKTCIRAIQERRNRIAAFGDTKLNMTGLLNNANVTPNNSSFDPYTATTATTMADFFINEVQDFYSGSSDVFFPSVALVSNTLFFRLISLVMSGTATTVKDHIEKALSEEGIKFEIRKRQECSAAKLEANGVLAPGTNKDRIVLYSLDPEVVERHIEMIQMVPIKYVEVHGLKTIYPMFGCTTETIVNYPGAFAYIDVAKSAA